MKPKTWLLLLFLWSFQLHAQLYVAKDNIACTYGLKDPNDNWVVKPGYMLMQQLWNGCFSAQTGKYTGIFSPQGKNIIPFGYYYVKEDPLEGIIVASYDTVSYTDINYNAYTLEGRKLFSRQYDKIICNYYNYYLMHSTRNDSVFSSSADKNGKMMFENIYGKVDFSFNDLAYLAIKRSQDSAGFEIHRSYGILDTLGKKIVSCKYDKIIPYLYTFTVHLNGKTGVVDTNDQYLLRPDYKVYSLWSGEIVKDHLSTYDEYIIENDEGKRGIIRSNYQIDVLPAYSSIRHLHRDRKESLYIVEKEHKKGVISSKNTTIIPCIYDELFEIHRFQDYYPKKGFLVGCKKGRFGLIDQDWELVVDHVYDQYLFEKKDHCFFVKESQLYVVNLQTRRTEKAALWTSSDSLRVFSFQDEYYSFYTPKANPDSLVFLDWTYHGLKNTKTESKYILYLDGSKVILFDEKGKRVDKDNIFTCIAQHPHFLTMHCKTSWFGLLDSKTGKVLLDTIYRAITIEYKQNRIWASSPIHGGWILFDTLGKRCGDIILDEIPRYESAKHKGLVGLLSSECMWLVAPEYKYIEYIKNFYGVETVDGKLGALDQQGKTLVDAEFTEFLPVYANGYQTPNDARAIRFPTWWIFRNSEKRVLLNSNGEVVVIHPDDPKATHFADSLLFTSAWIYSSSNDEVFYNSTARLEQNIGYDAQSSFRIIYKEAADLMNRVPFKREIYSIFLKDYEEKLACETAYDKKWIDGKVMTACEKPQFRSWYELKGLGKRYVSLLFSKPVNLNYPSYRFNNYIFKDNQLKLLSRKDIFGTEGIFQEELIFAIQSAKKLELDCSTPENLALLVGERISLSSKGVVLYLEVERKYVELLVPISRLKKHKETKWILAYLK